jgi:hypothetical protein
MSARFLVVTLSLAAITACSGRTLMYSASSLGSTPPQDAYACVADQVKKLGYRVRAHDDDSRRILAERDNPEIREANGLFRRGFDRLEITSSPDASGQTQVGIKAQSFKESVTARGNTLDEIEATAQAKADSKTILEACAAS